MLDIVSLPVSPFMQNCRFLIRQEDQSCVVVDPADAEKVIGVIEGYNLNLKAFLLTHGHLDHVAGVAELMKKYPDVKFYGPHKDEEVMLRDFHSQAAMLSLPCPEGFTPEFTEDGQTLQLFEDASFKVLHTPGHTPGGVCFYCREENFVLTGDTLFAGSVGRTDFPGGDFAAIIDSIKYKLFTLPDDTDVMSGHGEDSTIGYEKQHNPFVQ